MIIKPSDLEKIAEEQKAIEAQEVSKLFTGVVPQIDQQLNSGMNFFKGGRPIFVTVKYSTGNYSDQLTDAIKENYGADPDGWEVNLVELTSEMSGYTALFEFRPKPKTATR